MTYAEKTVRLSDGRPALLRQPDPKDAAELLELLKQTSGETEFLSAYPEEIRLKTEAEEEFIWNVLESSSRLMILCVVGGKIAGHCQVSFNRSVKTRHRASIAIAVLKDYWGLGIGTAMMNELVHAASEAGAEQLELEMIEGNERALSLYRKFGFETVGVMPDSYRTKDGKRRGGVYMRKVISGQRACDGPVNAV